MAQHPIDNTVLYTLAPAHLPSYRSERFTGDAISVDLAEFVVTDQQRILQLYAALLTLRTIFETHHDEFGDLVQALRAFPQSIDLSALVRSIQYLGYDTAAAYNLSSLNRVVHDIKGGGFAAAIMTLQMLLLDFDVAENITRLAFLVRDHLAIMRNCVRHLDGLAGGEESYNQAQHISIIEQTWDHTIYSLPEGNATIVLDSRFAGIVSASETEFAALRRALYNLINNAVRYTTDNHVYLSILGLPDGLAEDVRFVIYNRITQEHRHELQQRYPNDFGELFRGGFTTGGTGMGMRICGEFIAEDYGIDIDQCIKEKYIGATLIDGYFVVWFHWPALVQRHVGLA